MGTDAAGVCPLLHQGQNGDRHLRRQSPPYSNCCLKLANWAFSASTSERSAATSCSSCAVLPPATGDDTVPNADSWRASAASPDSRWPYLGSLVPGASASLDTSGGYLSIRNCRHSSTSATDLKSCRRPLRVRISPAVCRPRNIRMVSTASLSCSSVHLMRMRCSYLTTRAPAWVISLTNLRCIRRCKTSATVSSDSCMTGSRLDSWLQPLVKVLSDRG